MYVHIYITSIFVDKRKNENNLKYSPSFEYQGKVIQENIVPMKYDNVKSVLRYKYFILV